MKALGVIFVAFLSLNTQASNFALTCKEDIKKLNCNNLVIEEQMFCVGRHQKQLTPKCHELMHKEIESFKPVINACRAQMKEICTAFPKHAMKKCAILQVKKFTGDCQKKIQAMKKG